MKSKKRIIYIITFAAITIITLAGCTSGGNDGGDEGGGENTSPAPTSTGSTGGGIDEDIQYEIVWWGLFDSEEVMTPLIERYNEQRLSNVNIEYINLYDDFLADTDGQGDFIGYYRDRLDAQLTDGETQDTPDIVMIHNTWLGRYFDYLSNSTSLTAADIDVEFYPVVADDFVKNDLLYGVPMYMDAIALITNPDLMARQSAADTAGPESTWFDLFEQARRLTTRGESGVEISGLSGGLSNIDFLTEVVSIILMQSDINITDSAETPFPSQATFASNPETQQIIDLYRSLYEGEDNTWDENFRGEVTAFLERELVIFAAPSWRLNQILNFNRVYNLGLEPAVYKTPQVDISQEAEFKYWADYWGLSVPSDSAQEGRGDVAWDIIKFMTEPEQLDLYNNQLQTQDLNPRLIDILYPRKILNEGNKSDEYLGPYIESLENAETWNMVDGYLVRSIFDDAFAPGGSPDATSIQQQINQEIFQSRSSLLTE